MHSLDCIIICICICVSKFIVSAISFGTREKEACHYKLMTSELRCAHRRGYLWQDTRAQNSVGVHVYTTLYLQQLGPTPSQFSLARQVRWEAPDNVYPLLQTYVTVSPNLVDGYCALAFLTFGGLPQDKSVR